MLLLLACTSTPDTDTADAEAPPADTQVPEDTALPTDTDPVHRRGLWVWDTTLPGDPTATADLLALAATHALDTLFLACDPVGYDEAGAVDRYTAFVDQAHAADLEVYAMSGYGWFAIPCDAGLPDQPTCHTEGWDLFATCASSTVGFDGVMDDSETHSVATDHFDKHYAERGRWLIDYLQGLRERIDLPLHHTLPAWFDDREAFALEDGGPEQTLDAWIADTVDVAALMSYRDTAEAVLQITETERTHGPVWLGLELGDAGEGDSVDFSEEGPDAMMQVVETLEAQLTSDPGLHGVMLHDYGAWAARR